MLSVLSHRRVIAKGIALVLMLLISALSFFNFQGVVSANSLTDIYQAIKDQYPDDIDKMLENGATEQDIQNFVEDVEQELSSVEDLSEENIKSEMQNVLAAFLLTGKHKKVFEAVFAGWNLSENVIIDTYLEQGSIGVMLLMPESLKAIGKEVRDKMVAAMEEAEPKPDSGVNGQVPSASGNQNPTQASSIIIDQLKGSSPAVILNISGEKAAIEVKNDELKQVFEAGKKLEVKTSNGEVLFSIPAGAIELPAGGQISIKAEKLQLSQAEQLSAKLTGDKRLIGNIFELDIEQSSDNGTSPVSLAGPVLVALSYADSDLPEGEQDLLAVFRYNDETETWELVGGTLNKANRTVEWEANHFSKYALMVTERKTFNDIADHWARNEIEFLAAKGIVKGATETNFEPERTITRAEYTALLARLLDLSKNNPEAASPFSDVSANDWFGVAINEAYRAGLVHGVSKDNFEPNRPISRQELAAMMVNALAYKGIDSSINGQEMEHMLAKFDDGLQVSEWARAAMASAVKYGLIKGRSEVDLAPHSNTTRAEAAVIMKRLYDLVH